MNVFEREKEEFRRRLHTILSVEYEITRYAKLIDYAQNFMIEYCYEHHHRAAAILEIITRGVDERYTFQIHHGYDCKNPQDLLDDMQRWPASYFKPTEEDLFRKKYARFHHTFRKTGDAQYEFIVKTENGKQCCELVRVEIYGGHGEYVVPDCDSEGNPVIGIGEDAFKNIGWIETVRLPKSVKYIGDGAFRGCCSLHALPSGCYERIGNGAFARCTSLKGIVIPDTTISIGNGAFYGCDELGYAALGKKVRFVGDEAFASCPKLTGVRFTGPKREMDSITLGRDWHRGAASNFVFTNSFLSWLFA